MTISLTNTMFKIFHFKFGNGSKRWQFCVNHFCVFGDNLNVEFFADTRLSCKPSNSKFLNRGTQPFLFKKINQQTLKMHVIVGEKHKLCQISI